MSSNRMTEKRFQTPPNLTRKPRDRLVLSRGNADVMGLACCCPRYGKDLMNYENKFQVTNVDDDGKKRCPGIMLLTDADLVFHLKRGIFAFRCDRAEELFDLLQTYMLKNRISVVQNTESESSGSDSPIATRLPYRSGQYPSFANAACSRRPEPIGGENRSASSSLMSTISQTLRKEGTLTPVLQRSSNSGAYPSEDLSFQEQYLRPTCSPRHQPEREERETLECRTTQRDSSCTFWDTGYDSDDRREVPYSQRMGYENIPGSRSRRTCKASVSSSDSQSYSLAQRQSALLSDDSLPSSPSIFEEKHQLVLKPPSPAHDCHNSRHNALKRNSSGRDSFINRACAPIYFNFDIRQADIEGKQLNYIQVELESGCDSDNPQTPQSPASQSTTNQLYAEVDLEKTAALSRIRKSVPWDEGTRKTRHSHLQM
ncbi:fibroblast growth factor receptor substrate 2-like isoform X2 [Ambystoma mexicanum]|uniref:fibroblast growth factor receptor substrate 2-like isoform X2 n=1 Tax=Ambystoma mexicanum TaxID=8296 RepID=UPI0037E77CDD